MVVMTLLTMTSRGLDLTILSLYFKTPMVGATTQTSALRHLVDVYQTKPYFTSVGAVFWFFILSVSQILVMSIPKSLSASCKSTPILLCG